MKWIALMTFATMVALSPFAAAEDGRHRGRHSGALTRGDSRPSAPAQASRSNSNRAREIAARPPSRQNSRATGLNGSPRVRTPDANFPRRTQPLADRTPAATTAFEQAQVLRNRAANDRTGARDGRNRGGDDANRNWRNRNGNETQNWRNRNDRDNQAGNLERRRHHDGDGNHHWHHHNWDRNHHHRDWWRSHYTRFVLFGGGYYYWNSGFWYPAYGYDPYYSTYAYDAPIYGYNSMSPAEVMASVQTELARLGYYYGAIDGTYGPMTRSALLRYQRSVGLAETGLLDEPTMQSLGVY